METNHTEIVQNLIKNIGILDSAPKIIQLDISDDFAYRDPTLIELIKNTYNEKAKNTL
jgi:predicted protein tyrosine phosphatase